MGGLSVCLELRGSKEQDLGCTILPNTLRVQVSPWFQRGERLGAFGDSEILRSEVPKSVRGV